MVGGKRGLIIASESNIAPSMNSTVVGLADSSIVELNSIVDKIKKASLDMTAGENGDIGSESEHNNAQKSLFEDLSKLQTQFASSIEGLRKREDMVLQIL